MQPIAKNKDKNKKDNLFFLLLLLTGFFLLLEISFFIQCNKTYLSDFTFVSDKLHIPLSILPAIFYFLMAQVLVHISYCFFVWVITILITHLFQLKKNTQFWLAVSSWILGILTALTANQYFFPNSKFSELTAIILVNPYITKIALIILLISCSVLILFALIEAFLYWSPIIGAAIGISFASFFYFIFFSYPFSVHSLSASTQTKPNIIIIGVDSLRPDFLSYFGYEKTSPFFDRFLNQAAVLNEAVTPLARTFPSWTGILTGQYPREVGIRFNLAQYQNIKFENSLPAILQGQGYETIFATDETRFSNIDKPFGFNRIITPPMGLNDFLLGTFNDFPLSNILVNTWLGKWLFPYSYANRPVYFTYNPDTFLKMLNPVLQEKREKPIFLAVHFCLTHYPYLWASLPANQFSVLERYEQSIKRVDEQVNDFFAMLQKARLLDHAIVIMLSDHGEALELPGDRITEKDLFLSPNKKTQAAIPKFYPPSLDDEGINQSAGHGTDVLGLPQYHTLLAFKLYGLGHWKAGDKVGIVSLLDIKPTLLDLLNLPSYPSSGQSLAKIIRGEGKSLSSNRHIFLESDFTPEAIRTVYPETRKVLLEGIELFQIDPATTRLTVKNGMGDMIINSKQYADIYGDWMLAFYPQNKHFRMPILINLTSGVWTNNLQSSFAAHSPAIQMLEKLKTFYGNELIT